MKARCYDHIDLRVKDMDVAKKFYGKFLPQLGFNHESPGEDFHTFYSAGGDRPAEFVGFTQDKHHQPNGTRIGFWADTREEVDRLAKLVREAVKSRVEAVREMNLHYDHPILLLQHMLWHEGYHHGQVKLALKLAGRPLRDEQAGPLTWKVWMRKNERS